VAGLFRQIGDEMNNNKSKEVFDIHYETEVQTKNQMEAETVTRREISKLSPADFSI